MLFWAFFEQAGSSINNFTDRNVDRVDQETAVVATDVGQTLTIKPTQEQVGYAWTGQVQVNDLPARPWSGAVFLISDLDRLREEARKDAESQEEAAIASGQERDVEPRVELKWNVEPAHVGMGIGGSEVPASTFQAANPIFILLFGLLFTWLWAFLDARRMEPSTPVKFGLGLLQLALGFGVLWYGANQADSRGIVAVSWLLIGYLLHTTGELCLSPVGLSMVTRLSPARLVSTAMGAWFLATSFSSFLAGIIAQFTGVESTGGNGNSLPPPTETVHVYGNVFGQIGIAAGIASAAVFALSPLLVRWMHQEEAEAEAAAR
jgi:POT family proton-dependent oligopeptide transporter